MQSEDGDGQMDRGCLTDERARFLGRHFVGIGLRHQAINGESDWINDDTPRDMAMSAFVLSVKDHWLLITAGHWFDEIEEEA